MEKFENIVSKYKYEDLIKIDKSFLHNTQVRIVYEMTNLGTLVSYKVCVDVIPITKLNINGREAFNMFQSEEINKLPDFVQNALVEYINEIIVSFSIPIDNRYEQFSDYHKFTIYRCSRDKYVFSFTTIKQPPCVVDSNSN